MKPKFQFKKKVCGRLLVARYTDYNILVNFKHGNLDSSHSSIMIGQCEGIAASIYLITAEIIFHFCALRTYLKKTHEEHNLKGAMFSTRLYLHK